MVFSEERVDEICLLARLELAKIGKSIRRRKKYRGFIYTSDIQERYWSLLNSIEYRKDFDNSENKFQRLVFLLYNKLAIAKVEQTINYIEVTVI